MSTNDTLIKILHHTTESIESLETKTKVYKNTEQIPEEIKMSKMNTTNEHDKAVLAKEDPMFAKNKF